MNARAFSEREAGPVTHERACAGCGAMGEHTGDSCEPCEIAYAAACYHALRCGCASCVIYDRMRASRGAPACAPAIAAALATPDHDRGVMLPPAPASPPSSRDASELLLAIALDHLEYRTAAYCVRYGVRGAAQSMADEIEDAPGISDAARVALVCAIAAWSVRRDPSTHVEAALVALHIGQGHETASVKR